MWDIRKHNEERFPSKKVFAITWIVLLIYLSVDFILKGNRTFEQLNYDWAKIEILEKKKDVIIDSISHDYLVLKNTFNPIESFTTYDSYAIENQEISYFRASSINITEEKIFFSGVKWINRIPSKENKDAILQILDLPILQSGKKKIITIGDSQLLWRNGRDFRKNLLYKNSLTFLGSQKDVYGYPNEAYMYATAKNILDRLPEMQQAPYYLLFFGAHDKNTDLEELSTQICQILLDLNRRPLTKEIILITLPRSPNLSFNAYNIEFNEILRTCSDSKEKVKIVDLYTRLQNEDSYLMEDAVHLNEKGYHILNKLLRGYL